MVGLSAAGFERKRLPDIKTEIENYLKATLGETIDLRAESVFGQIVGVLSLPIAEQWEQLEKVWLAFDPDYSDGVSLDSLAALAGITRISATSTLVAANLYGSEGTVVPAGAEARNTQTGDTYLLSEAVTITKAAATVATARITSVDDATDYTVTLSGTDYEITSDADATEEEIRLALSAALSPAPEFVEIDTSGEIRPFSAEPFSLSVSGNIEVTSIASPGIFKAAVPGAKFVPAGAFV